MRLPKERPKLALIGHTYAPKHNREKAAALSAFFEVRCFIPDCSDEESYGKKFTEFDSAAEPEGDHTVLVLPKLYGGKNRTKLILRGLHQALEDWKPDLVLVDAEPWSFLRWQSWLWCWKKKNDRFFEFTWENVRRPGWKGILLEQVYRLAVGTNRGVICGNQAAKKLFLNAGQRESEILVAAQLGIPDFGFPEATETERDEWKSEHGIPSDCIVVGFCGRFIRAKGLLILAEAISQLSNEGLSIRLCMLGHGELKEEIQQRLRDLVIFISPIGHSEVPGVLKYWDLLVLPSQRLETKYAVWEEQFGRVIIEAVASGVPAIGSNHGAIPEVLGVTEAVFEEEGVESLTERIRELGSDTSNRKRLLEKQRSHVFEKYTHTRIAAVYAAFLMSSSY